jgi:hypothetical protein
VLVVQWKFGRREGGILRGGGCGALHGYKGGRVASLTCIPDSRRGGGCEVWLRLPLGMHLVLLFDDDGPAGSS